MRKFFLTGLITAAAVAAGGCTALLGDRRPIGSEPLASHAQAIATETPVCLERLGDATDNVVRELESDRISLVSWNVKKGVAANWRSDLDDLALDTDLVLMQEATLRPDTRNVSSEIPHWSFAPGYRSGAHLTGVMTHSSSEPLAQCNLTSWEPWLGTPKATGITKYGLTGTDETLIVVNIHVINFTFGVREFQSQLEQIRPVLAAHQGPIILSGDFNTWRKKRREILDAFVGEFSLETVNFDEDHRKTFFGQRLDHIYVRGLKVGLTGTRKVNSSDHNPLFAEFML